MNNSFFEQLDIVAFEEEQAELMLYLQSVRYVMDNLIADAVETARMAYHPDSNAFEASRLDSAIIPF